ncbi:hypothetical protein SPBR_03003 [Sporothrix brasiliensis 5110]|uniref:Uncharacterized protein n=1 Tax=Sporothrix brasiliensis 5110 TaxID=1398154 RepID=A0A0C2FMY0_9PEZI|nr:uncharacterized protein SPBR_03003 [Sporothrix brasiliensis 5110]KIH92408.1 hypothetical protein SPBR_03003 [Sporothrix brasiliensis 5110]
MARLRIPSRHAAIAATVLVFLHLASSAAAAGAASKRTCYFPDGSVSSGDFPCADTGTTHCCNAGSACLSTGYCMSAEKSPYLISRGSCTDNAWGPGCPAKCAGINDNPKGGLPISWTGTSSNAGSPLYCCGPLAVKNGNIACANSEDMFVLGASELMFGVAILANTTQTNGASASSSSSVPAASASDAASCSSAASPDSSGGSSSNAKSSSPSVTAVGAGVGVSLGVVAATFATWALYERRKRHQQLQAFMNGTAPPGMAMAQPVHNAGGPGGGAAGGYGDATHMNNTGTPFSPHSTTGGTPMSNSPGNGGLAGVYAANSSGTKSYPDGQQPLVELSAYPRQVEELPAHDER